MKNHNLDATQQRDRHTNQDNLKPKDSGKESERIITWNSNRTRLGGIEKERGEEKESCEKKKKKSPNTHAVAAHHPCCNGAYVHSTTSISISLYKRTKSAWIGVLWSGSNFRVEDRRKMLEETN